MSAKLIQSTSIYLAANILSALIPFILLPFLTRILSPENYGLVAMFEAVVVLLSAFTGVNLHGAISVQFYKKDRESFPEFVSTCLMILIITASGTMLTVICVANRLVEITGITLDLLLLAVLVASSQFIINVRLTVWQVSQRAERYGLFQVGQIGLNAGLSILFLETLFKGSDGRILGFSIAIILASILSLVTLKKENYLRLAFNRRYAVEALRFGLPLVPHMLGGIAVAFADRFILKSQVGFEVTGIYFAAMQLAAPLAMVGTSFNRAFTPWLYEKLAAKQDASAVAASYLSMIVFVFSGFFYALILYFATPFLLGEKYQALRNIEPLLVFGGVFQAMYFSVVNYIFYTSKTIYLSVITLSSGITYVLIGWYLTKLFGAAGLAATYFMTQVIVFFAVWLLGAVINRQPWFDISALRAVMFTWCTQLTNLASRRYIK
jgi:O-antigen/teichoic acid export membrane protein